MICRNNYDYAQKENNSNRCTGICKKSFWNKTNREKNGKNAEIIFRGQSVDKPLLPKLARLSLRIGDKNLKKTEQLVLSEFERGILPLQEFKHGNKWDLIALA